MRPADLTPAELADMLHHAFEADLGDVDDPLGPEQRAVIADYLGCHPEARDAAWDAWLPLLEESNIEPSDAEYWLDVEFIEPCPESALAFCSLQECWQHAYSEVPSVRSATYAALKRDLELPVTWAAFGTTAVQKAW